MKILNLFPIVGLYNELYLPKYSDVVIDRDNLKIEGLLNNINTIFWKELFSRDSLFQLVMEIKNCGCDDNRQLGIYERIILANPELFVSLANQAIFRVINQNISAREFFKWVEIISIACKMFSLYRFSPYELTIQDGFLTSDYSSEALIKTVLDNKNPIYRFLSKNVFPYLDDINVNMVWINGAPKVSTIAIAMHMKQRNSNIFIGIKNHSSEYYSMNKITSLLKNNKTLFQLVDCIVLDDNKQTSLKVEDAVSRELNLIDIPNIMYFDKVQNRIVINHTKKINRDFADGIIIRDIGFDELGSMPSKKLANLRLNPNTQCYWKRCTFCGINEKYNYITEIENQTIDSKLDYIQKLLENGVEYLWFEDEAIHPDYLNQFCNEIISRQMKFMWQVRARFHIGFTPELCKRLFLAGLREIRFGLESANNRILGLMNKFDSNVTLIQVEEIVKNCTQAGIHVHFPMIVGYPSESCAERKETYDFLNYLRGEYKYFSYNINILMLDVSSKLYKNFADFNISSIQYPCPPNEFLGNVVSFDCSNAAYSYHHIDLERQNVMAKNLYPWIPNTALTKSHILYRLSETIRNTLIWSIKERNIKLVQSANDINAIYKWNSNVIELKENGGIILYNWDTHAFIKCSHKDFEYYYNKEFSYGELMMTEDGINLIKWGILIGE